jgi:hypothetical protein
MGPYTDSCGLAMAAMEGERSCASSRLGRPASLLLGAPLPGRQPGRQEQQAGPEGGQEPLGQPGLAPPQLGPEQRALPEAAEGRGRGGGERGSGHGAAQALGQSVPGQGAGSADGYGRPSIHGEVPLSMLPSTDGAHHDPHPHWGGALPEDSGLPTVMLGKRRPHRTSATSLRSNISAGSESCAGRGGGGPGWGAGWGVKGFGLAAVSPVTLAPSAGRPRLDVGPAWGGVGPVWTPPHTTPPHTTPLGCKPAGMGSARCARD